MAYLGVSIRGGAQREEELRWARTLGYNAVEISMDGTGLIFGGRLQPRLVPAALRAFRKHDIRYSVHGPRTLDLRDRANREIQMALARSTLEFCRAVGGRVLVLHYEQRSADPEDESAFDEGVLALSDEAGEVVIGVENIEVERIDPAVECVRRLNRPNVGLTLDVGHAHLAAAYFRFDFLEGIRTALPYLRHVHVNDNFGRYDPLRLENFPLYRTQTPADTFPIGKGDLHLPVGWGSIPFGDVFKVLRGYRGAVIHEYLAELFLDSAEEDFARVEEFVSGLS
jgi:sugar phosphate isomerase/epimerase